jgi:hypothetical protein
MLDVNSDMLEQLTKKRINARELLSVTVFYLLEEFERAVMPVLPSLLLYHAFIMP